MYNFDLEFLHPIATDDLIRLGRNADGGYVVPQRAIDQSDILLSLGISDEFSFDTQYASQRPAAKVIGVDHTVRFEKLCFNALGQLTICLFAMWHGQKSNIANLMHFFRAPIEFKRFFENGSHEIRSQRVWNYSDKDNIRLDDLLKETIAESRRKLFLKMDIEGSEYRALPQMLNQLDYMEHITGMVIEFHDLDLHWETFFRHVQFLKNYFYVVHAHGNNCTDLIPGTAIPMTMEITFVNKDLYVQPPMLSQATYPLATLDYPNDPHKPDYSLNFASKIIFDQRFAISAGADIAKRLELH